MGSKSETVIDAINKLEQTGILKKLTEAGIVDKNLDLEGIKKKAETNLIKKWYVVCPDPGESGSCVIHIDWDVP